MKVLFLLTSLVYFITSLSITFAQQATQNTKEEISLEDLHLRQAFYVANACEASYLSGEEIANTLNSMGVTKYKFLDFPSDKQLSDTQVLVATLKNYTLVCFRGTQETADWKTNINVKQTEYTFGERIFPHDVKVHTGFYNAWKEVKESLITYLNEVKATKSSINFDENSSCHAVLIGGHSLGGALALIAGIDLFFSNYSILGIYTFGQPKVFNKEIQKILTPEFMQMFINIERFVFKGDVIPTFPPTFPFLFEHVGIEKYSSEIGKILKKRRNFLYWPKIGDHKMTNYVKTIAALILNKSNSEEDGEVTQAITQWLTKRNIKLTKLFKLPSAKAYETAWDWSVRDMEKVGYCGQNIN